MRKHFLFILFCFAAFQSGSSYGQQQDGMPGRELYSVEAEKVMPGAAHLWIKQDNIIPTFAEFQPGHEPDEEGFLEFVKRTYKLPASYGSVLQSTEKDKLGYLHKRYMLTVNNIPVNSGMYVLHIRDGKVEKYNGYIFKNLNAVTTPALNESAALSKATADVNAHSYKWEIASEEKFIKEEQHDQNATFFPKGELIILQSGPNTSNEFHLAWRFDIYAHEPMGRFYVYVDAVSGKVLRKDNRICTADINGTATTVYRGNRTITADSYTGGYRLREVRRGNGINTYNLRKGTNYGAAVDFQDADNLWNNVNANLDQYATDAHWAAERTWDYYDSIYGRNSIDGAGYALNLYVHYSTNYVNAYWDGTRMTFGDGDATYRPLVSLDITGHEITHGLTTNTANLDYLNESGALNESFSDVFGTAIEYFADNTRANWTIGEDIGAAFRSHSNPNSYGQPDTYRGTNWYTGTADNGGVHTNSGVQNYWYYLLCMGGSGTNDIGNTYSVTAIGRTKASAIAWRNLTNYLVNTSDYADARYYAIQSATDLYGACTPEVIATTKAWYAVGVGADWVAGVRANFTNSNPVGCSLPFTVNFTNSSVNSSSYTWYFGDGGTAITTNASHTYNSFGTFTVKLVARGGSCGTDSITRTALVNINASNPCIVILPSTGAAPTQTACSGTIYDDGGQYGAYSDNSNSWVTIAPSGATTVRLTFTRFRMENAYDYLYVYNGPSTTSPLLGTYTGTTLPASVVSTGPAITVRQFSDAGVVDTGFAISWTCTLPSAPPTANFIADDTNSCSGRVQFLDKTTGGVTSWKWTFGDGDTSALQNPTHNYLSNGTFTVTLTARNAFGNNVKTRTSYIYINKPAAPAVVNGTRCGSGSVNLSATTSNSVKWYAGANDTASVSSSNPFATPSISGPTNYYCEEIIPKPIYKVGPVTNTIGAGSNFNGNAARALRFNVNHPCKLVSTYVYAQGSGYRTIVYRDTSGIAIQTRNIYIPNGGSRITLNFNLIPGGPYELGVQDSMNLYRNSAGASYPYNDAAGLVSIIGNNIPPGTTGASGYYYYFYDWEVQEYECVSLRATATASITAATTPTISITGNDTICASGSTVLNANPTGTGFTFAWNTGDNTPSITVTSAGTYTVSIPSCGTTSTAVNIYQLPDLLASFSQVGTGSSYTFNDLSTGSPNSWSWSFGDGNSSSLQSPTHVYASGGSYTVRLIASNGGCSDTMENVIDVNGASGISNVSSNINIDIYPNPASDEVFIKTSGMSTSSLDLKLYDVTGSLISSEQLSSIGKQTYKLNVSTLAAGVYFVRFNDEKGHDLTRRIVVNR